MLEVVVPIHNAAEELRECLQALATTLPDHVPVLLLDDASTDPAVDDLLQRAASSHASWRTRRRSENAGFVVTANEGIQATSGDVVLLNSDTIPAPGWYQALGQCLQSRPEIATVTPWSNNGEIVSIPEFCRSNPVPRTLERIGSALKEFPRPDAEGYPELPTAVGFCMAISRRALDRVGLFDARHFGVGYGEENDFSRRCAKAGFHNVLCPTAYVAHHGNASFGPRGLKPSEDSMQRLLARHPEYLSQVQDYIQSDPLAELRQDVIRYLQQRGIELR